MGGNVFATPARRLTTEQLLMLLEHTRSHLEVFFSGMEITRFFGEKTTHGDLDVLCGLWHAGTGWKGSNQEGVLVPAEPAKSQEDTTKCEAFGKDQEREWTAAEVKLFCEVLGENIGAVRWEKHGYEISYAVPCAVIDPRTIAMPLMMQFYQVDLLLVQPSRLRFSVMTQSYGVTALLFAAAVRRMSSSLTCHNDRFVIRYSPYQGLKAIEVELTSDPLEFMEWAGLDPDRFEQGFKTEKEYWLWLTCLTDENQGANDVDREDRYGTLMQKRFPQGWKVMAGKKSGEKDTTKMPKGHTKVRLEAMARFTDWLKTTIYAPKTPATKQEPLVPDGGDGDATTPITLGDLQIANQLSTLTLGTSPPAAVDLPLNPKEQNLVDPAKPRELSHTAHSTLQYFQKEPEWTTLFEIRKQEAKVMAERQARNNRDRAAVFGQPAKTSLATTAADTTPVSTIRKELEGRKSEELDEGVSL